MSIILEIADRVVRSYGGRRFHYKSAWAEKNDFPELVKNSRAATKESGQRKYRLQRDSDVRFLLLGQTVVPEVYVDLVEKVARDVRDQPAVPPRRSPIPIRVPVAPSPPPFATELVPTT
ncbi:hypothetical protein LWI29_020967 [Acer saccharum]|uniref:Uncharacterized protein n=1 Tax=Acer saccharum TaxID=4024 RepID=A0AA39VFT0_ACESA|nr:hypothetical protein LWI29_020967 [Acer saccharum]